jgi:hypothetical protein
MAWFYEILGKDDEVLEISEAVYALRDGVLSSCARIRPSVHRIDLPCRRRVEKWRADYVVLPFSARHGQADKRGNLMRRLSIAFGIMILAFLLISRSAIAQGGPEIGVWKLNLGKSKFYNSQPPKNETRIVEPDGDGVKVHVEGVAGDGSPIDFAYSYTYSDGKDSSATGNLVVRRANAHTFLATTKRDGKIVAKTRAIISNDGRVMKFFYTGIDEDGKRTGHTAVWDKQ